MGAKTSKPTLVRVILPNGLVCCYEGPTPVRRVVSDFPGFEVGSPARLYRSQKDRLPKDKILQPGRIYFLRPVPFIPIHHFLFQANKDERDSFATLQHLDLETGNKTGTESKIFSPFMSTSKRQKENHIPFFSSQKQVSPISSYLFKKQNSQIPFESKSLPEPNSKSKPNAEPTPRPELTSNRRTKLLFNFGFHAKTKLEGSSSLKPSNTITQSNSEPKLVTELRTNHPGSNRQETYSLFCIGEHKEKLIRIPIEENFTHPESKPMKDIEKEKEEIKEEKEVEETELDTSNMSEFCKGILTMEPSKLFRWRPCLPIIKESDELDLPSFSGMRHRRVNTAL